MKTTNIGIWGDSITYGAWDTAGGWADRLRIFLHQRAIDSKFEEYFWVYNLGIPGETSRDLVKRFEAEREPRTPDLILFAIGINDTCGKGPERKPRVPLEEYRKNIEQLAAAAKQHAEKIAFVGLVFVDEAATQPFNGEDAYFSHADMIRYDEVLREICAKEDIPFIDMLNVLSVEDLYDGLHPNTEGHQKMFARIKDELISQDLL